MSRANSLRAYGEMLLDTTQVHTASDIGEDLIEFAEQWEAELATLQTKPTEDAAGILIRPEIKVE